MGINDFFQYKNDEDYLSQELAPFGATLESVRSLGYAELPEGNSDIYKWSTPSGKIELKSDTLDKAGFAGVPAWEEPPAPKSGQFYLLAAKSPPDPVRHSK